MKLFFVFFLFIMMSAPVHAKLYFEFQQGIPTAACDCPSKLRASLSMSSDIPPEVVEDSRRELENFFAHWSSSQGSDPQVSCNQNGTRVFMSKDSKWNSWSGKLEFKLVKRGEQRPELENFLTQSNQRLLMHFRFTGSSAQFIHSKLKGDPAETSRSFSSLDGDFRVNCKDTDHCEYIADVTHAYCISGGGGQCGDADGIVRPSDIGLEIRNESLNP